MSATTSVLIDVVCPTLGVLISNVMFVTPLPLVLKARQNRHLGNVNPVPFAVMFVANIGYVIYGAMLENYYVFFSAIFGVLFSLFYCITCLTIMAKEAMEDEFSGLYLQVEALLIFGIGFWSVIGLAQSALFKDFSDPDYEASQLVGFLCDFFSICYYAAPLSTMANVIHNKDASSLYLPAIIINCVNATMWMIYGIFSFGSIIMYGPSTIGLLLSLLQVALVFAYHQGKWLDAVSGFITRRTIHVKTRVFEGESPSPKRLSPELRTFSTDRESVLLSTPGARRMTFVVAPDADVDIEQPLIWE